MTCPCKKIKGGSHFGVLTEMWIFQYITLHRATNSWKLQAKIRLAFHFVERNEQFWIWTKLTSFFPTRWRKSSFCHFCSLPLVGTPTPYEFVLILHILKCLFGHIVVLRNLITIIFQLFFCWSEFDQLTEAKAGILLIRGCLLYASFSTQDSNRALFFS